MGSRKVMEKSSIQLISVIVPTCHRNDLLQLCLDRLAPGKQLLSAEQYEVIVTDDGIQTTAEIMIKESYPWVRWVPGPRRGPSANRNNGVRGARGDWLVFTDDDCLPSPEWLLSFVEATREHVKIRVFEGCTSPEGQKHRPFAQCPVNEQGGQLWSCNFAIQRLFFGHLGGFDERFKFAAMEDMELHYRIKKCGEAVCFIPKALVRHPWKVLQNPQKFYLQHLQSQLLYLQIHPEEKMRVSLKNHLRMTARYFVCDFRKELADFGWTLVRSLPRLLWQTTHTAWILIRRPNPEAIHLS